MEISMLLRPERALILPYQYMYQLQSTIYALLRETTDSEFWHDKGFGGQSGYKGFCFSGFQGDYRIDQTNRKLIFTGDVTLEVRGILSFMDDFQRAIECHPSLRLFDTDITVVSAALKNTHLKDGDVVFHAITPVVTHSTSEDGHAHYYLPGDEGYDGRLGLNAQRKFAAINGVAPDSLAIRYIGDGKKVVTRYKNVWITGYTGLYKVESSVKMAEFLYQVGLGEKNAQGFGFLTLSEE